MSEPNAICRLCGERVPSRDILDHLFDEHDFSEEIQKWPDGTTVWVDKTLKPEDFGNPES